MKTFLIVIGVMIAIIFVVRKLYLVPKNKQNNIYQLPLQELGFQCMPAYPIELKSIAETLVNLFERIKEIQQAKHGLITQYTIKGVTANAYTFVYGVKDNRNKETSLASLRQEIKNETLFRFQDADFIKEKLNPTKKIIDAIKPNTLTDLHLDSPEQFSISWTTFGGIYDYGKQKTLKKWANTLLDAQAATDVFFPMIANYGIAYNLLILQKVLNNNYHEYVKEFKTEWTSEMDILYNEGNLYCIDMRILSSLEPQWIQGAERFTPTTFTWLKRDVSTKKITPFAISIIDNKNKKKVLYTINNATSGAWIYALQAVKVSVTVYGIWLGHVYPWHIVTASMIMNINNTLPNSHTISELVAPHAKHIIGFNNVLLFLWKDIAPPTSLKTAEEFLNLINEYAKKRSFFDDDPKVMIKKLGLIEADFTNNEPWDMYPIVGYTLEVWDIVEAYVESYIDDNYKNDEAIEKDEILQDWIKITGKKDEGNIRGLPKMKTKKALKSVMTSLLYRITIHGISRLNSTINPALSFVSNFPPCLQDSLLPDPSEEVGTQEILNYLPNTGTIGEMITFYYTLIDSAPYQPMIPVTGVDTALFFDEEKNSNSNIGLLHFRKQMLKFMTKYTERTSILDMKKPQIHQWPNSVET